MILSIFQSVYFTVFVLDTIKNFFHFVGEQKITESTSREVNSGIDFLHRSQSFHTAVAVWSNEDYAIENQKNEPN